MSVTGTSGQTALKVAAGETQFPGTVSTLAQGRLAPGLSTAATSSLLILTDSSDDQAGDVAVTIQSGTQGQLLLVHNADVNDGASINGEVVASNQ